jgi:3-hydroxyacyl-CoA dehydrogenase
MQLLENVKISKSSAQSVATCMAMGKMISKKAILVGNCPGFVGNRMLAPYSAEFRSMVENGAGIQECDDAAKAFGMPMGPATLGDLVGLELFWKKRQQLGDMKHEDKTSMGPYELTDWLCEKGRYGLKTPDKSIGATGRGIFIYKGRDKMLDPEVIAKAAEIIKAKGIKGRTFSTEEITERMFFPMINEGFKILEEGYAQRPSDIDVCYIFGYGFPPAKGGPMFYAEKYVGMPEILKKLKAFDADAQLRPKNGQQKYRDYFVPSKLLEFCVQKDISSIQEGVELWRTEGPGSKMASKL